MRARGDGFAGPVRDRLRHNSCTAVRVLTISAHRFRCGLQCNNSGHLIEKRSGYLDVARHSDMCISLQCFAEQSLRFFAIT